MSAPFFGIHESIKVNFAKKLSIKALASIADDFVITRGSPLHLVSRNKQYLRQLITSTKAPPLASFSLLASFIRCIDRLNPARFGFAYLMVLAEKDHIVSNRASKAWRDKTKSKIKTLKLVPGAYHELAKEPNNDALFEASLKFIGERISQGSAKPFGQFKP